MLPLLAAFLYLLLSVRIMADIRITLNDARKGACIALRIWKLRLYLDMPIRMNISQSKAKGQVQSVKGFWSLITAALSAVCWGQTDVYVRLGMQDAALAAMAAGTVNAFGAAVQAVTGQYFPCSVKAVPVFGAQGFALKGRCIFSLVPGDIIFAVAKAAVKKTQREGFSWLSIPLKA